MNKGKQVLKEEEKKVNRKSAKGTGNGSIVAKIAIILAVLAVVVSIGIISWEQLRPVVIVNVDGRDLELTDPDVMYQIYQTEYSHNTIASLYQQMGMSNYWDTTNNEGLTNREAAKEEAMDAIIQHEVLYSEAVNAGYEITEADKETAATATEEILGQLTDAQKKETEFTESSLGGFLEKLAMVERYREDVIDSLDVDDEGIRATVDAEEYREYKTEYFYVSLKELDEEGNSVEVSDEAKEQALADITEVLEQAKDAEDWSTLLPEDEEEQTVTYGEGNFIAADATYSDSVKEQVMAMENGAISEVLEGDDGYYIVRMNDNNSTERYEQQVSTEIESAEYTAFEEYYQEILAMHTFEVNDTQWDKIQVGNTVISAY